jgi:hypothetical protein
MLGMHVNSGLAKQRGVVILTMTVVFAHTDTNARREFATESEACAFLGCESADLLESIKEEAEVGCLEADLASPDNHFRMGRGDGKMAFKL